jgi:hypothetical protein
MVNRLQFALDAKDATAAALRRDHEALEDGNTRLTARLDRALAPQPALTWCRGEDVVSAMVSTGVFDSVLHDALRVAHRFAHALAEVLRCVWTWTRPTSSRRRKRGRGLSWGRSGGDGTGESSDAEGGGE